VLSWGGSAIGYLFCIKKLKAKKVNIENGIKCSKSYFEKLYLGCVKYTMLKYKHGAIKKRLHSLNATKFGYFSYNSCSINAKPTQIKKLLNQVLAF
jgi:hypothetical protein